MLLLSFPHPSLIYECQSTYAKFIFQEGFGCSVKLSCCERILRHRCLICRCFLNILMRAEVWLPLGRLVQLSTIIREWQSEAGSPPLTIQHFTSLPQGQSLHPCNAKISNHCLPDVILFLCRDICESSSNSLLAWAWHFRKSRKQIWKLTLPEVKVDIWIEFIMKQSSEKAYWGCAENLPTSLVSHILVLLRSTGV